MFKQPKYRVTKCNKDLLDIFNGGLIDFNKIYDSNSGLKNYVNDISKNKYHKKESYKDTQKRRDDLSNLPYETLQILIRNGFIRFVNIEDISTILFNYNKLNKSHKDFYNSLKNRHDKMEFLNTTNKDKFIKNYKGDEYTDSEEEEAVTPEVQSEKEPEPEPEPEQESEPKKEILELPHNNINEYIIDEYKKKNKIEYVTPLTTKFILTYYYIKGYINKYVYNTEYYEYLKFNEFKDYHKFNEFKDLSEKALTQNMNKLLTKMKQYIFNTIQLRQSSLKPITNKQKTELTEVINKLCTDKNIKELLIDMLSTKKIDETLLNTILTKKAKEFLNTFDIKN